MLRVTQEQPYGSCHSDHSFQLCTCLHKERLEAEVEEEGEGRAQSTALLYQRDQDEGQDRFCSAPSATPKRLSAELWGDAAGVKSRLLEESKARRGALPFLTHTFLLKLQRKWPHMMLQATSPQSSSPALLLPRTFASATALAELRKKQR